MDVKQKYIIGVIAILVLLLLLAPFADPNPDGLESAAEQNNAPDGNSFDLGILTDYGAYGSVLQQIIGNEFLSTIVSGLIGVIIVFCIFIIPYYILKQRHSKEISSEY
ncbi:MAG: PDGLE domain-containing protein [Promethearchaeota archaeon]